MLDEDFFFNLLPWSFTILEALTLAYLLLGAYFFRRQSARARRFLLKAATALALLLLLLGASRL